jgi:hypothetical protein
MLIPWLALHLWMGNAVQPPAPFLTGPSGEPPLAIASQYLHSHAAARGLATADLDDVVVMSEETSAHSGVTHIYLRQRYRGIDVAGADVNFNITRDGRIIDMGGRFIANLAAAVNARAPAKDAVAAVGAAARSLGLHLTASIAVSEIKDGATRETIVTGGGISERPIPVKLVYQPVGSTKVRLAWQLEIQESGGQHWWVVTIDAASLEILDTFDRIKSGW